nr:hypothetical protein [Tanacetum cinerariifolium]
MSTLVFVDLDISTQADEAQSSRVPVPLPEDPYETFREAYLVGTDTKSELIKEGSGTSDARYTSSDSIVPLLPDHPLTDTRPVLVLSFRKTARLSLFMIVHHHQPFQFGRGIEVRPSSYEIQIVRGMSKDRRRMRRGRGLSMGVESLGLGGDEAVPEVTPVTAETKGFFTRLGAQVEMHGGFIRDHTIRLWELSPDLFERYDRDVWSYLLGRVDTRIANMSLAEYDDYRLVHDMLLQQVAL